MKGRASDAATRTGILFGSIRARPSAALMLFLVAAIAIAAAAVGPTFVESANKSVFSSTLSAAPPGESDLDIISTGPLAQMSQLTSTADYAVRLSKGLLAKPIFSADVGVSFKTKSQGWATDVFARTDICAHVKIVSGSCPRSTGQVAMSRRSARAAGVRLGEMIPFKSPFGASTQVTVTGIYLQPTTVLTPDQRPRACLRLLGNPRRVSRATVW